MDRDKKRQQEQQERIFSELLRDDANQHCADCGARGPKWASWNIGVFLCIRCGGVHRKLGTHISKVKSITLDTWTAEQIESIRGKGNAKANLLFNPNGITPPRNPSDRDLENYIRDKYERKVFMSASSRATLAATSASAPSSSSHAPHSHSHSHSGGAAAYPQQLRQLHDMGFTHDPFNIQALDQAKGNVQAAVDIIIAMGPPPASAPTPSTFAAPRAAADSNAFFKQAPAHFDSSSPALRQLKGMGFTDEPMTLLALQKADGNLDAAILWLTERADQLKAEMQRNGGGGSSIGGRFDQTQYAQQFLAQQQQQQQPQQARGMSPAPQQPQQQQQQQPQKPKNDLLDLFGDGDPFSSAAPAQPTMQPFGGMGMAGGMMGGMGGMMQQPQQQQPFGTMGSTPNPFGSMQSQQQQQQPANPFAGGNVGFANTGSSGGGSAPNPFGDFISATPAQPQQQQQPQLLQKTGASSGGAASDILSLYNQPKPQQQAFGGMGMMQQPQAQQGMMMGGMQQQQPMMGGVGLMGGGGMIQQQMMGGGGMQANPFGGAGMGGGMMMGGGGGVPQQQQAGFGNMGMTGMGMSGSASTGGNYSMVSIPFNAAQQPKSNPSPFGASASASATPDPFAGLGNMAAFGQTQQPKPASANNTNPFM